MQPPVTLDEVKAAIRTLEATGKNRSLRAILATVTTLTGKRPSLGTISTMRKLVQPAETTLPLADDALTMALTNLAPTVRAKAMEEAKLAVAAELGQLRLEIATQAEDLQELQGRLSDSDERIAAAEERAATAHATQQAHLQRIEDLTRLVDRLCSERDAVERGHQHTVAQVQEQAAHAAIQLASAEATARSADVAAKATIADLSDRLTAEREESGTLQQRLHQELIRVASAEARLAELTVHLEQTRADATRMGGRLEAADARTQQLEMALRDSDARASNYAYRLETANRDQVVAHQLAELRQLMVSNQEPIHRIEESLQLVSSTVKVVEVSIRHRPDRQTPPDSRPSDGNPG